MLIFCWLKCADDAGLGGTSKNFQIFESHKYADDAGLGGGRVGSYISRCNMSRRTRYDDPLLLEGTHTHTHSGVVGYIKVTYIS